MSDKHGRTLYCGYCREPCAIIWEDCGIGSYEFWGAPGVHEDWRAFSACCNEDIYLDVEGTVPWDSNDYQPDEGEY